MMCQSDMRSSVDCASWPPTAGVAHGCAATVEMPLIFSAVAAIVGSSGCESVEIGPDVAYVPGAFALIGSPWADVLKMMYCAFAFEQLVGAPANALGPRSRMLAGIPVASARNPM